MTLVIFAAIQSAFVIIITFVIMNTTIRNIAVYTLIIDTLILGALIRIITVFIC